jgi:hypothetical protein
MMAVMDGDDAPAPAGMTFTAYAERISRSQPYVSKLVTEGIIHGEALIGEGRNRRILPDLADAQRAAAAIRPKSETGKPADSTGTLNAERLRLTALQADRAALENKARRGELVPRSALAAILPALARAYVDQLGQVVRDTITNDVERALLLDRMAAATEKFITKAQTDGGAETSD